MTELATQRPSLPEILAGFGDDYLSVQGLFSFCFVPPGRVSYLKERACDERWGANDFVLVKYLAIHLRLAIEQQRFAWNGDQIVLAAGHLTTRHGVPLFLGLVPNSTPDENPWVLNWVGERPKCSELPPPPELKGWPQLDPGAELVLSFDLEAQERRPRLADLDAAGETLQRCAIGGALAWSLRLGLEARQLHAGGHGYMVPLFLRSRADLAVAPDLVAPLQVQGSRLVVRALLEPHLAYAPARAAVERWEQLPGWLIDAWDEANEGETPPHSS